MRGSGSHGWHVGSDIPPVVSSEHSQAALFSPSDIPQLTMPDGYKRSVLTWFGQLANRE
jgi:hypothetical protein